MYDDIDDDLPHPFEGLTDVCLLADAPLDVHFTPAERHAIVDRALTLISELYVHLPFKRAVRAVDPERRLRLLQLRVDEDLEEAERVRKQQAVKPAGLLAGLGLDALFDPPPLRPGSIATRSTPPRLQGLGLDKLWAPADADPPGAEPVMSDREFNDEMLDVFASLHDLHTRYMCPDPVRQYTAFLPLLIEECWDRDDQARTRRRYVVSKVAHGCFPEHPELYGAEVTHWNGVPIERAVLRRAQVSLGANAEAQHARGVEALTCRWLGTSAPPDEEWVRVTYRADGGEPQELDARWLAGKVATAGDPAADAASGLSAGMGLDPQSEMRRRWKYTLFAGRAGAAPAAASDAPFFDTIPTAGGEVGYLRIYTFDVTDIDAFVDSIREGLEEVPARGLVIDIRGNPGGDILASERVLALLCARPRQLLQFRVTPLSRRVAEGLGAHGGPRSRLVVSSIKSGLRSGASYSSPAEIARIPPGDKPVYTGPVVLIVDARCYSSAEVFSAGFQDCSRGLILGTAGRTGGGAGNSWPYEALQAFGGRDRFPPLPGAPGAHRARRAQPDHRPPAGNGASAATGQTPPPPPPPARSASFVVAVRRLTRAGSSQGETFEEVGVQPDRAAYRMTRDDVLGNNKGLRAAAARLIVD